MSLSESSTFTRRRQLQISERKLLLAFGDVAAVVTSILLALFIWAQAADTPYTLQFITDQSIWFFLLTTLWVVLASANDLYDLRVSARRRTTALKLITINAQMIVLYVIVFFISPRDALPRLFVFYYGIISFLLIGLWRFTRPYLLGWVSEPRKILIIGTDHAALTLIRAIQDAAAGEYQIAGVIGSRDEVGRSLHNVRVAGTEQEIISLIHQEHISELVITDTRDLSNDGFRAVMAAYENGLTILPMALLYEWITARVPVEHIRGDWAFILLSIRNSEAAFVPYLFFKRAVDIGVSLLGLTLFAALLPFIALAIRLDSPGGIFYTQERVGLNGRSYRIYKLRSMVADAEARTGAVFSHRHDARVTRVGRFMRRTRLDEVPQLFNILIGDMTLIGPRPERPEHMERLTSKIPFYRTRLIVRPGLTGWAQVRYNYGATDEDALVKLEYDLYYIRHQSLLLDINILLRTVRKVLSMAGT